MKCLITGCDLVDDNTGYWVHGDLHEVGGAYVFNCCLKDGEAAWTRGRYPAGRRLCVCTGAQFFERRGVLVVAAKDAQLNAEAAAYVQAQQGCCAFPDKDISL